MIMVAVDLTAGDFPAMDDRAIVAEEVESQLKEHADVLDAVVVGLEDERFGQKVVAVRPSAYSARPSSSKGQPQPLPGGASGACSTGSRTRSQMG